jgi:hypothetical protein
VEYAAADLLYYRAGEPETGGACAAWDDPRLAGQRFGVRFMLAEGDTRPTRADDRRATATIPNEPFRLAGLSLATTLTGSV